MIDYETFDIHNIKMSIASDDTFFISAFRNNDYWDWNTLISLKENYIDSNKNIVEIGSHCGTSTCFYASSTKKIVYAFEPQKDMFELLNHNINQNDLKNVVIKKEALFYKNGNIFMDTIDTHKISNEGFNRGGLSLGIVGESIKSTILNDLNIDDCGFLHIDAQGAEQHIFYSGLEFIKKHKPVILWENNIKFEKSLVNRVNLDKSIPNYIKTFDIEKSLTELGYKHFEKWSGIDTLSIPDTSEVDTCYTNAYVELPSNGLGCHITSMIVACEWCNQNQKYLRYKMLPSVHHNKIGKNYNNEIEKLFGFNTMDLATEKCFKIPYEEIYNKIKPTKNTIKYLKNLFNKNNFYDSKVSVDNWVIHIRRNDVNTTNNVERYISYERYNEIIKNIRKKYNGKILILSDGCHKEILTNITDNNIEIDTESNSLKAFCKMVYCKNLVVGFSSFSYAAGVYNENNVYYDILTNPNDCYPNNNYYHPILDHWLTTSFLKNKKSSLENSIAIVGMCKNVEVYLKENVFDMIEIISKQFDKVYIYIYTNDNTDNTLTLLENFKENNCIKYNDFTIENENGINYLYRADLTILVYGRNKCLEYARKKNVNYMAMIDLDNCLNKCKTNIIKEMIELLDNDNVVAVSKCCAKNNFYDKFSYRSEKFNKCIHKMKDHTEIWAETLPNKINKVDSYFGGLCIYKMNLIPIKAKYSNMDNNNNFCCEHVAFNEMLKGDKYIYVVND